MTTRLPTSMLRMLLRAALVLAVAPVAAPAAAGGLSSGAVDPATQATSRDEAQRGYRVLVYSRTAGFRHQSIPAGVRSIRKLGRREGFGVDATEDPAAFTSRRLGRYAAVVFLSTTGDVLPKRTQRAALQRYIRRGGGWFGVHAAADMAELRTTWPWYLGLVGAAFKAHPCCVGWAGDGPAPGPEAFPNDFECVDAARRTCLRTWMPAVVRVEAENAWNAAFLPRRWRRVDEWYAFLTDPRPDARVLLTLDESTYSPGVGAMGPLDSSGVGSAATDHPIAWCHRYGGGRSVYTALGHTTHSFTEPDFVEHLRRSIQMAAGRASFGGCSNRGR